MVRLVFRPYTHIRRSICTSESLRAFTKVSPGFTLYRHSSPSFGYQHICSYSNLSPVGSWSVDSARTITAPSYHRYISILYFHYAFGFPRPNTCTHVRLLGPCFKTGRNAPFRQSPEQQGLSTLPIALVTISIASNPNSQQNKITLNPRACCRHLSLNHGN